MRNKISNESLFLLFIYFIIKVYTEECSSNYPIILQNQTCVSLNCSEFEFKNGYCTINNSKIQTQWLTNIIIIGDWQFRYINFATYSNGDFIVETTACPRDSRRMFYGLKANGREFFKNGSAFFSINTEGQINDGKKYEGEILIIRITEPPDKDKEFVLSITKDQEYFELYDYENEKVYQKQISSIIGIEHPSLRMFALTSLFSDNKYYSLYGFINNENFYLYKFSFSSKNIGTSTIIKEDYKQFNNAKG